MGRTVAKSEERELRDLLERTQAEVKRLQAELEARERTGHTAARQAVEQEMQGLRERVRTLEQQNAALREDHSKAVAEQLAGLEAEVALARKEAGRARDETQRLKKQLEATSFELRKAQARRGAHDGSLLSRLRALFSFGNKAALAELGRGYEQELERAQREITRLQQQVSLHGIQRKRRSR
ncbi:hypothetical protein [Hyalangium gracile]|uniref:hypothetical protein n=1 Tax=Hyalangium gracile TaxID=394092 RepID=UPI001CCE530D|nr:hypothetical protein [Hyalangium gracile]